MPPTLLLGLGLTAVGLVAGSVLLAGLRTPVSTVTGRPPAVSVVIPVRDEARSLPNLLASLHDQTLPPVEVLVVDDGSTDASAQLAAEAGATVVAAPALPAGWIGKSWACHTGARHARGDVLVFLDADVVVARDGIERIVAAWEQEAPGGLLSVQPFHTTSAGYEQLSAYPNLVAMMATGAFAAGQRRWSPVAFGPCLATSAEAYRAVGGHEAVAGEVIEDIHLARAYGASGRPVQVLAGGSAVSFRMYPGGIGQLVEGWSKNLAGGPQLVSTIPLVGAVAWVAASMAVAMDAVTALVGTGGAPSAGGAADVRWLSLLLWTVTSVQLALLLRRIGRFAWWAAPAFPLLLAGFAALFVRSAVHRSLRRSVRWRGRTVAVRAR